MELLLGWVRTQHRVHGSGLKGGHCSGVCYRLPKREDQVGEALYRPIGEASCPQSLVVKGESNHPIICWRDNPVGQKHSRRFLECVDDNFFLQVMQKPLRRSAMMDFVLTNKEGLVGNVKLKGSLSFSGQELVEFKILGPAKRLHSKLSALDFRRTLSSLFKELLSRLPWNEALEERGAQRSWLTLKVHLLQV